MYIIYDPQSGKILDAIYKRDWFLKPLSIDVAYQLLEIDEINENKAVSKDLARNFNKRDINNNQRFYIQNGELFERDGWEEYHAES